MNVRTLVVTLFGVTIAGMVLGAVIGLSIGALSPNLIGVFLGHGLIDPVKDGAALGILNGAIFGFFGGIAVVLANAIWGKRSLDK